MRRLVLTALLALCAAPAAAQQMDPNMPGMAHAGPAAPPPAEPMTTAPPPVPADHAADRDFDPAVMAAARLRLAREHGGMSFSKVSANLAEYQAVPGGGGYRWEGAAWFGGDVDRLVLRSEGEGGRREGLGGAEVQALYSHAVGPYFDVQAGVRQSFSPGPARTYATVGFEGLAPYWVDVQSALFLSTKGDLLGRLEATQDYRITQRLILQPRAELNFAAQDVAETRTGSGLSEAELGLRLRYEIRPQFAPYVGVSHVRRFGRTADLARAAGEDKASTVFVAGVRAWF